MFKRKKQRNALVKSEKAETSPVAGESKTKIVFEKAKPLLADAVKSDMSVELASDFLLHLEKYSSVSSKTAKNSRMKLIWQGIRWSAKGGHVLLTKVKKNRLKNAVLEQDSANENHDSNEIIETDSNIDTESKISPKKKLEIKGVLKEFAPDIAKWALGAGAARIATLTLPKIGAIALPTGAAALSLPVVLVAGGVVVFAGGTWYYLSKK